MAHFAELNSNNIVRRVIVVNNKELIDYQYVEHTEETTITTEDPETNELVDSTEMLTLKQCVPYESEEKGIEFCQRLFGADTVWKQTSYNGNLRKNFAGKGFTYDADRDAFIAPQPFNTWVLNEDTCRWEAPVAYPDDGEEYVWNDNKGEWELRAV